MYRTYIIPCKEYSGGKTLGVIIASESKTAEKSQVLMQRPLGHTFVSAIWTNHE